MDALHYEAAEITTGPKSLREILYFKDMNAWKLLESSMSLTTLLTAYTSDRYTLVDAQYFDCDPSISGAFRTKFLSNEHFGSPDVCPDTEWVCPALRDYAEYPWESVWYTIQPLFRNDAAGPRVLRIHLVHTCLDRPVDLFTHAQAEGHP